MAPCSIPGRPAPVHARMLACYRVFNAVMKALAQAVPEKVIACGFDTTTALDLVPVRRRPLPRHRRGPGRRLRRRSQATRTASAPSAAPLPTAPTRPSRRSTSTTTFFRMHEYSLRTDSGGAGRTRGGLGYTQGLRGPQARQHALTMYADRFQPGAPGPVRRPPRRRCARCTVERDGRDHRRATPRAACSLETGDIVTIMTGGGAGYGDPGERDPELIGEDVADGLVTPNAARHDYGWRAALDHRETT